jgi:hypothetical protein
VEAAAVIERELERLADMVADRLAERLAGRLASAPRLLTARELADALGVEVGYCYRHAAELGAVKLGATRNAPLRFDLLKATEALRQLSERPEAPAPAPQRRSRRRASSRSGTGGGSVPELLPIRAPREAR